MSSDTGIDFTKLITDVQSLATQLKENDKLSAVVNKANTLREMVRARNDGMMSLKMRKGQTGMEFNESVDKDRPNTRQLRELDEENRLLRALYEDAQWTLHLVMQRHRSDVQQYISLSQSASTSVNDLEELEEDGQSNQLYDKFVNVAVGLNEILRVEDEKMNAVNTEIENLTLKNALLRELLAVDDLNNLDVEALLDKMENKTPIATPNVSVIYVPPSADQDKDVEDPVQENSPSSEVLPTSESSEFVPSF